MGARADLARMGARGGGAVSRVTAEYEVSWYRTDAQLDVDEDAVRSDWKRYCAKFDKSFQNYKQFCRWFDGIFVPNWISCQAPIDFDIEDGPEAKDLFPEEWLSPRPGDAPVPGKGQQDIFGGEVQ